MTKYKKGELPLRIGENLVDWQSSLRKEFQNLNLLVGDDFSVYLVLIESSKEMTGSQIQEKLPDLKRTHIYSILTRLHNQGWIEICNPGERPAHYRALDPLRSVESTLEWEKSRVGHLENLKEYIRATVLPAIGETPLFGGRVTRTFIINSLEELQRQLIDTLTQARERIFAHASISILESLQEELSIALHRIMERNKLIADWDHQLHSFPITAITHGKELDLKLPVMVAQDSHPIWSQIFVIDATAFLFLLNPPIGPAGVHMGLGLRIEDIAVANAYAHYVGHTFIENYIDSLPPTSLDTLDGPFMDDSDFLAGLASLFDQNWRVNPNESAPDGSYLGLISPDPVFGAFRDAGILYHPFDSSENHDELIEADFQELGEVFIREMKRHTEKEDVIEEADWEDSEIELLGIRCYVKHARIKFKDQMVHSPEFTGVPLEVFQSKDVSGPPSIAAFNFQERAAVVVWAVNPYNVIKIMQAILGIKS